MLLCDSGDCMCRGGTALVCPSFWVYFDVSRCLGDCFIAQQINETKITEKHVDSYLLGVSICMSMNS